MYNMPCNAAGIHFLNYGFAAALRGLQIPYIQTLGVDMYTLCMDARPCIYMMSAYTKSLGRAAARLFQPFFKSSAQPHLVVGKGHMPSASLGPRHIALEAAVVQGHGRVVLLLLATSCRAAEVATMEVACIEQVRVLRHVTVRGLCLKAQRYLRSLSHSEGCRAH